MELSQEEIDDLDFMYNQLKADYFKLRKKYEKVEKSLVNDNHLPILKKFQKSFNTIEVLKNKHQIIQNVKIYRNLILIQEEPTNPFYENILIGDLIEDSIEREIVEDIRLKDCTKHIYLKW